MNKIRRIGLVLLVIGIGGKLLIENSTIGIICAFIIGASTVMLITGKFQQAKFNEE